MFQVLDEKQLEYMFELAVEHIQMLVGLPHTYTTYTILHCYIAAYNIIL